MSKKKLFIISFICVISIVSFYIVKVNIKSPKDIKEQIDAAEQAYSLTTILKSVSNSEEQSLKKIAIEGLSSYDNQIKKYCRYKYIYKNSCELQEINLKDVYSLHSMLVKYVDEILEQQQRIEDSTP